MSFKSKNLEYDDRQPAFLRRMRGEIRGSVDDPDRQVNPAARPKLASRLKNDEDDGPTYVMEDSQDLLTKAEYEALVKGEEESKSAEHADSTAKDAAAEEDKPLPQKQKVAEVGGLGKKRKAAKIIGDESEKPGGKAQNAGVPPSEESDKKRPPKKKKAKAIKLSFGDDDEK